MVADRFRDKPRGDRRAVVVQHADHVRRVDVEFVDQHRVHLRVAVLLDHEHLLVRRDELGHRVREREGAQAQRVQVHALGLEHVECLVHRRTGRAEVDHAEARGL